MSRSFKPDIMSYFEGMDAALGKKRKRSSSGKSTSVKKVTPSVKKYVKKAIGLSQEVKENVVGINSGSTYVIQIVNSATVAGYWNLLPSIVIGTDDGQRVGSKIDPKKLILSGSIWRRTNSPTDAPYTVRMHIGRLKNQYNTPALADQNLFLRGTNGTITGPAIQAKNLLDLPINDDYWDVKYTRDFQLGLSTTGASNYQNNDKAVEYRFKVDCTKFIKKHWTYTTGNQYPQNDGLFVWFLPYTMDESAPVGTPNTTIAVTGYATLKYTDA